MVSRTLNLRARGSLKKLKRFATLRYEAERIRWSKLFDAHFYLTNNTFSDGRLADPALDYVTFGAALGLNPHPQFDAQYYVQNTPAAKDNPLIHYLTWGRPRGLPTCPRTPRPITLCGNWARQAGMETAERIFGKTVDTSFVAFGQGETRTLDIVFSRGHVPEGKFSLVDVPSTNFQLFLNVKGNDAFHRGIPSV